MCYENTALRTRTGAGEDGRVHLGFARGEWVTRRAEILGILSCEEEVIQTGWERGTAGEGWEGHTVDPFWGLQPAEQRADGLMEPASAYAKEGCLRVKNTASDPSPTPPRIRPKAAVLQDPHPRPTPCPLSSREVTFQAFQASCLQGLLT